MSHCWRQERAVMLPQRTVFATQPALRLPPEFNHVFFSCNTLSKKPF
jgi:hypothetical protein